MSRIRASDARGRSLNVRLSSLLCLGVIALLGNGVLADDRLDIDPKKPDQQILHLCKADGTPLRPLINNFAMRLKLDRQGSPCLSADGLKVAFDACPSGDGFSWLESRIVVANMDGTDAKDICDGMIPSFSPGGEQLVVSRAPSHAAKEGASGQSIWVISSDGSERKLIADQGAWGGQWSPDGTSLVFHCCVDENGNSVPCNVLRIYDLKTEKVTNVFTTEESPFEKLGIHFAWSRSGRQVACTGKLKRGPPAAGVIDIDLGIKSFRVVRDNDAKIKVSYGSPAWHPDGDRLMVKANAGTQFIPYVLPLDPAIKPKTFDGLASGVHYMGQIFTNDNQLIATLAPRLRQ